MTVEGDAHDRKSEEIARSDMPDFHGRVDNRVGGELEEDDAHSDEDGHDGQDTHITKGIHGYK